MSVRIDNDFWKNYAAYEGLLKSCFTHLYYKKYKMAEGPESAYNFLVAEFFRKNIFDRFDAERQGIYNQTTMVDKTDQKKFEQYIYKWTESTLGGLYNSDKKLRNRNVRFPNDKIDTFNSTAYEDFKASSGITSWENTYGVDATVVYEDEEDTFIGSKRATRTRPSMEDAEDYRSETPMDAHDEYVEKELNSYIDSILKNEREREIVQGKREGLSNTAIGEAVGISSAQVANIIKGIYSRCAKVLA